MKEGSEARLLFQQLQNADGEAVLVKLHNRYFSRIFKLIHSLVKQRESAEELASDVFVQLWLRRKNCRR